ncbi:MAG: nitroreductase family protein [Anaerolineae bacterium]|nr:nitroreductase family protein [Anaerolineae bacterium]
MSAKPSVLTGDPVRIEIDKDKCIECHRCLDACPLVRFVGFASIEDQFARYICLRCGGCMAICPQGAITISDLPPAIPAGEVPSSDEVLNLIKARRSVRAFKEQRVRQEDWDQLLEAVKYSPVGHNSQYIDVMIIESPKVLAEISRIGMGFWKKTTMLINKPVFRLIFRRMLGNHAFSVFSKAALFYDQQRDAFEQGLDPILFDAPALMLFLAPETEMMGRAEADMAAQTVALYAPALGLGTCYSGIVMVLFSSSNAAVKKVVPVPRGYKVYSALIVGYPKHARSFIPYRRDRNVYRM